MMIGMAFQVVGLETTSAARSAFITALFVAFVQEPRILEGLFTHQLRIPVSIHVCCIVGGRYVLLLLTW